MKSEDVCKVIIIDDNSEFIEALKLLFHNSIHFEVIDHAYNGQEIVNHPKLRHADLLLMDINMPLLDGISAARQINFHWPKIKMVAITLNCISVNLEVLIRAGFQGLIDKAHVSASLTDVLHAVVANQYAFPKDLLVRKDMPGRT